MCMHSTPCLVHPSSTSNPLHQVLSPSRTQPTLVLKPALPAGTYTFALTATAEDGSVASAAVAVVVNSPPRNGFVAVTPTEGTALQTLFTFSTSGWVDDVQVTFTVSCVPIVMKAWWWSWW